MRELQQQAIAALHVNPEIDVGDELERRVRWLTEYARSVPGVRGFVLGISGGQDSALAGKITQIASARLRADGLAAEFIAVRLPYATQRDEHDAQLALTFISPDRVVSVDIAAAVDALVDRVAAATASQLTDFNKGNVKARMRMVAQYAIAGDRSLLVVGTDHAAESLTGFFTKFGDGAADVMPLAGLTKSQGAALLQELGAPARLWRKTPTADLLDENPGQSDEASLGVSYTHIDDYLSGKPVAASVCSVLERRYLASEHKRQLPVTPTADWWRREGNHR